MSRRRGLEGVAAQVGVEFCTINVSKRREEDEEMEIPHYEFHFALLLLFDILVCSPTAITHLQIQYPLPES